jgi:hypothetical protein
LSAQKSIKERLVFMAQGIRDQHGFQWDEYEAVCRDALARIEAGDALANAVVQYLTAVGTASEPLKAALLRLAKL